MRRGTPPTLPGGANLESPSGWLNYSRAYRRGDDKFHLACCQMKHLRTANQPHMPLCNELALHHPAVGGVNSSSTAPLARLTWSHADGDSKLAPPGRVGDNHVGTSRQRVPPNGGAYERQRPLTNRARWHQALHTNPVFFQFSLGCGSRISKLKFPISAGHTPQPCGLALIYRSAMGWQ